MSRKKAAICAVSLSSKATAMLDMINDESIQDSDLDLTIQAFEEAEKKLMDNMDPVLE